MPLIHHAKVNDFSCSLPTKDAKQLSNTSNSDTAFNGSDETILLEKPSNERKIDQDLKETCSYGLKDAMNGLGNSMLFTVLKLLFYQFDCCLGHKSPGTSQDQFGMLGILSYLRSLQDGNTSLSTLTYGIPLLSLHKHANVLEKINDTNNGALAENPLELRNDDIHVPPEYIFQHKIK